MNIIMIKFCLRKIKLYNINIKKIYKLRKD